MRYDHLILDVEEAVLFFTWNLNDIDEEIIDEFVIEVIDFVLEYAADKDTAKGAISEYVRETVETYATMNSLKVRLFKRALEGFCESIHEAILSANGYNDQGHLYAKFHTWHGNDVVLKRLTDDELAAYAPVPAIFDF